MRGRMGWSIVVAALVLALAAPASGQQAPTLGAPPTPNVTVASTQSSTSGGGGGLKTWQEALIFAAGIILIGGITIAILTDARERSRRIGHRGPVTEPGQPPDRHRHRQRSKQQARARGKAARAQRRKNR
jgi:hypothetical protein